MSKVINMGKTLKKEEKENDLAAHHFKMSIFGCNLEGKKKGGG